MLNPRFKDRTDAGRRLAEVLLKEPRQKDTVVLALPRGGVHVAVEVARALGVALDVLVVRKLGHPLQPELAVGAVATGGVRVMNPDFEGTIPQLAMAEIAAREEDEVESASLQAVGYWYDDFAQLTDHDVCLALDEARSEEATSAAVDK